MKRKPLTLSLWATLLLFSASCKKDNEEKAAPPLQSTGTVWEAQLSKILTVGNESLKGSSLKMTGYRQNGILASRQIIKTLKSDLLSDDKLLPDYSPVDLKDLQLIRIADVKNNLSLKKHRVLNYDLPGTAKFLDTTLKIGQKMIEITWENDGKPFTTQAVVDDQSGIIYDNLISNIMIIKEKHTGQSFEAPVGANFITAECLDMPFPDPDIIPRNKAVGHSWTANWLWGSQRGEASVNHSVEGYTDRRMGFTKQVLTCSSVDAYSYMTLGSGDAQIVNHTTNYGQNGSSYVHWGLYLAAPTVSISMSYSPATGYSISVSGGFGSELHHTGSEYISALHFEIM